MWRDTRNNQRSRPLVISVSFCLPIRDGRFFSNGSELTTTINTAESSGSGDWLNHQPGSRPQDMGNNPASRRGSDMESGGCTSIQCFVRWRMHVWLCKLHHGHVIAVEEKLLWVDNCTGYLQLYDA